ncbi:hypothetical protein F4X86_01160 [Candidatus Saccharibacteria bacterium]|nr:hypothetical protein [Candidatus Saccharibacteria bacterium]
MNKVITIKTDAATKKAAQELAQELGLTLNSLINSYLKQVIVTRHVELYAPEPVTPKLEKLLEEAEESIKKGEVGPEFDDVDDFINDLRS